MSKKLRQSKDAISNKANKNSNMSNKNQRSNSLLGGGSSLNDPIENSDKDFTEELAYVEPLPITLEDRTKISAPDSRQQPRAQVNLAGQSDQLNQTGPAGQVNQSSRVGQVPKYPSSWARDVHVGNYTVVQGNSGSSSLGAYVVWTIEILVQNGNAREWENESEEGFDPNDESNDSNANDGTRPGSGNGDGSRNKGHRRTASFNPTSTITIHKRYSDIYKLRQQLLRAFPSPSSSTKQKTVPSSTSYNSSNALDANRALPIIDKHNTCIPELPPKSVISRFRESFLEKRRKGIEYFLLNVLLNPVFCDLEVVTEFVRGR